VERIFANVPVLDGGGRGATTTFAQRKMGDALATFESEVPLIRSEFGDDFDVVYPGWTVLAENPVSVVDKVVDRRGTRAVAEAYLKWLWSDEGQTIARATTCARAAPRCSRPSPRTSAGQHLHRGRGVRRLEEGAEDPLRRWRHLRPDRPEARATLRRGFCGKRISKRASLRGLSGPLGCNGFSGRHWRRLDHPMSLDIFWFLPTSGDTRYLGTSDSGRPATNAYMRQIAVTAEQLGYDGLLIPTGASCLDPG
jgi:hypothetical protein